MATPLFGTVPYCGRMIWDVQLMLVFTEIAHMQCFLMWKKEHF